MTRFVLLLCTGLVTLAAAESLQTTCWKQDVSSWNWRDHEEMVNVLASGTAVSMDVDREHYKLPESHRLCKKNETFGFTETKLWVSGGCRATFTVCYDQSYTCDAKINAMKNEFNGIQTEQQTKIEQQQTESEQQKTQIEQQQTQIERLESIVNALNATVMELVKDEAIGNQDEAIDNQDEEIGNQDEAIGNQDTEIETTETQGACKSMTCENGGICSAMTWIDSSAFKCACKPGFEGQVCETVKPIKPTLSLSNNDALVPTGENFTFTCQTPSTATPVTYSFFKNFDSTAVHSTNTDNTYILTLAERADTGFYSCTATIDNVASSESRALAVNFVGKY